MKEKNNRHVSVSESTRDKNKMTRDDVESVKSQFKNGKSRIKLATAPKVHCLRAVNPERDYVCIMNE